MSSPELTKSPTSRKEREKWGTRLKLRIKERTLEKWVQGRAKPNPQAAALVLLVRKYPDTLGRLDALGAL